MKANAKFIPAAALCAAAFLLASCAGTTPAQEPETLAPEDYIGSELKTTNDAYQNDTEDECRVLAEGFGETQIAALDDAKRNAEAAMGERIGRILSGVPAGADARERARAELLAQIRMSEPDLWDRLAPGPKRHSAKIGAALRKDAVAEKLRELEALGKRAPRLAPPLEAVEVGAERFPATVSGMKSRYRHGETAEIFVTPESDMFLTVFSVSAERQALVVPAADGKNFRRLRAGEKFGTRLVLAIENPGKHQENDQLVFVLTKNAPGFRAPSEREIFSADEIAAWLNALPREERFVLQSAFAVVR